MTSEIDWRWTFNLCIDVKKLSGGGGWVHLDYSVSSGPLFEIGDGPGPKLDNIKKIS